MLLTASPQLVNTVALLGIPVLFLLQIASVFYVRRFFLRETPNKTQISKFRKDLSQFSGELADLEDRFTRFQKREGMRAARAEKTSQADLRAEAEAIMAQGGSQGAQSPQGKLALYNKARGH